MKTQITASAFWKLYLSKKISTHMGLEEYRHCCILGFTAIDAAIYSYWSQTVLPEWGEFMSLVQVTLEDPESLAQNTSHFIKKSQLMATLRFISNTGDAERFTPNFLDFSVYLALRFSDSKEKLKMSENLAKLQPLRNNALHTGKEWSEIIALESIKTIDQTTNALCSLGKNFREAFDDEAPPISSKTTLKKVA